MEQCEGMQIVLIGAGNVATSLGVALKKCGHTIVQVYSRTHNSASQLAQQIGCEYTTHIDSIAKKADIFFVCLPDDVLGAVAPELVKGRENQFFVHTAGSLPLTAIPCEKSGVMWPIHSFSKKDPLDIWADVPLFIETSPDADATLLHQIADNLSDKVYAADSQTRKSVHLAAVFCNNFSNYCYAEAEDILSKVGIPFSVMMPMIEAATRKVGIMPPKEAQTGPAARGDSKVIAEHIAMLSGDPQKRAIYELMTKGISELEIRGGS